MRPLLLRLLLLGVAGAASCGDDLAPTRPDAATDAAPSALPFLCVFDYDLTLSSNQCPATEGRADLHCRTTVCGTYGWHDQCLGLDARAAVAACVERGAYIGIASHANVDACWDDKVTPIVGEAQFPEWTGSARYADPTADWQYPALDDRSEWNCDDCDYTMSGSVGKPAGIGRVMRYYGMDPGSSAARRRVIFWDDTPSNIEAVRTAMPEVVAVPVPRNGTTGAEGGCGITTAEIELGWAAVSAL